ncbi:hypothetical protein HPB50_004329 [Hyalomma asiaticum]|uniref:Uncharacterized protein n=1 Tax=Hyalomma asiaticum TaxID=266040 RepID=A0ACB7SJW9_HYAAI|nr:hypothetical protein HPB50_004329 [Hyalomma asiaticum]
MSQDGAGEEDDLSPEEMLKWRQTHIYDAAYQDSLRKEAMAATAKAAVWQQIVSRNNKSLKVNGQEHEVTSYSIPNSETCKGIIYIDRVCLGEVISEKDILPTLRECNPQMHFLEARCTGKTSDAVLVTFLGTKVPFWVKYEMAMLRCKPFRQRMEACTRCWTVGHRPDVCPTHKEETCHKCGTVTPPPGHLCIPKCVQCSGRHETGSVQFALRYKPKLPVPKVDKTPTTPITKPPLQTKKQGPLPRKTQEEEWPPLSATSSSNKSSPPQVSWPSVASHSSLRSKPDAPIYALLQQIEEENRALRKQILQLQTPSLCRTTSPPQPASDKQTNITSPPISENNETTTMDTSAPPNIVTATKRKSSDDGRDASEEHDKLSRKLAAHIRNSNNRFEALEKRMDSLEAKLESLTSIVHNLSTHISGKFNQIDERLNHIDERFSQIIEKLDRLHGRVP